MKKIVKYVLAIMLIVPCLFMLVGCGKTLTKAEYIEAFESVKTAYANYLLNDAAASPTSEINEGDFVDANNDAQAKRMTKASLAMVYFVRNICEGESYEIKNAAVDCIVDDSVYTYDVRLLLTYDNGVIIIKVVADYGISDYLNYFVFKIDYDFEEKVLNSFSISGYSGPKDRKVDSGVRYYKFADNNLKVLSSTAECYAAFSAETLLDLDEFLAPEKSASPADYSVEYLSAMEEANS